MRMGKPDKVRKGVKTKTAGNKTKPKYASSGSIVGKLSPDIISSVFAPELIERATECLEKYSDDLLTYSEQVKEFEKTKDEAIEADLDSDGTIQNPLEPPTPPPRPLYQSQYWVNELSEVLNDTSEHFQAKKGGWRIHANAAKFERLLDEKYGVFRPFITNHPEIEQFVRSVQRKYATGYFSPFRQGKPPIPRSTAVVILFMMQRGNLRWEIMVLSTLFFLIGLQPWALVVLVAGGHTLLESRRKRPIAPMKRVIPTVEPYYEVSSEVGENEETKNPEKKNDILRRPVGTPLATDEVIDTSKYDTIILGSGPSCLYTASLLSRSGRKVLVLSPRKDASGCFELEASSSTVAEKFKSVPFDIECSNVSKISKQQSLLAPALSTTSDYMGGIRFAKIGSDADGYAFEILSVPGMGTDRSEATIPFILRATGVQTLLEDAALLLGDGMPGLNGDMRDSACGAYIDACQAVNASSSQFYLTKAIPESYNSMRSTSTYQESAIRYASTFLNKGFPLNAHPRSLMAAIGMKAENIKPSMTSMGAHVTNICSSLNEEGMHYPIGGPRSLCHALASVVEQYGGRVLSNVIVSELLFEASKENPKKKTNNSSEAKEEDPPRCIGVKLADERVISFDISNRSPSPAVISMHGLVTTFIRLLPEGIRVKHKVPRGLPALSERRPVFKALFALKGSATELNLTGADFYRLPGAALALDEVDSATGAIKLGEIGASIESKDNGEVGVKEINEEPSENPEGSDASGDKASTPVKPDKKRRRVKFESGVSWIHISFPSAKDPSFESRHGNVTTCVVTIEADDDFVVPFDTKPKLYVIQKNKGPTSVEYQRLLDGLKRDLVDLYPQLEGKIELAQLVGPFHRGLSHNPERYAAKGVRPDTPYPGLYIGGSDLTVGESFGGGIIGGWLAANAVMGYSAIDHLFLEKSITSDIEQFLELPDIPDEPSLAVPFSSSQLPVA